jgi:hypothetical protein
MSKTKAQLYVDNLTSTYGWKKKKDEMIVYKDDRHVHLEKDEMILYSQGHRIGSSSYSHQDDLVNYFLYHK